jgi:hypothetical protein
LFFFFLGSYTWAQSPKRNCVAHTQSVFLPLLTARINQEGWPDVVAQEVSDSMHRLVATGAAGAAACHAEVCWASAHTPAAAAAALSLG